ncbi:MAG: MBL fold metallo-hydrolase, partial [Actinomycetota bacterium]
FSGDHIMQGSTVVIAPPDGDMVQYLDSLRRLLGMRFRAIAPAHGDLIEEPARKIKEYLAHRQDREDAIVAAMGEAGGETTVDEIVARVYVDVGEHLHPIARHSVHAHLLKLVGEGRAQGNEIDGPWALV